MQVVPEQQNGRLTAILILVIVLILVYLLGFHWFVKRHLAYAEQIDDLHHLWGALDVNAGISFMVVMQHRHVAMRRIEWNCVRAGPPPERLRSLTADLARERHQRPLHGVALDSPVVCLSMQHRVIAEPCRTGELHEHCVHRWVGIRVAGPHRPLGRISVAANRIDVLVRGKRRGHHLVARESAGLVRADH